MMNKRLLMLSGLAILAVVMNHASYAGFIAMFWWTDRYLPVAVPNYDQVGSLSYYGLVAEQKLALFSVPSFLFITGMFLAYAARGSQSHLTWAAVRTRIFNLIPPYLIWSLVYFAVEFLVSGPRQPLDYALGILTISKSVFFYIPLVIVYYLVSPFLAPLAKKHPRLTLAIGAAALLLGIISGYIHLASKLTGFAVESLAKPATFLLENQVFEYLFYYVLGMVVGFHQAQFREFIVRFRWALLGLAVVAGVAAVAEAEWVYQSAGLMWRSRTLTLPTAVFAISFILAFLAFENLRLPNFLYHLGVSTLGIYLIHETVLLVAPKVVYHVLPFVLGIELVYQPLLIATAVGVPLLMMALTRRLPIRKFYRYLYG